MGVTGLWTVVAPCARPIKIETLNKKRLAVDASIWIYQFLKAVRDKEGNALRNSHVVGFFRRICKLLFYGIKPVFVFDGGAPVLKRQTISGRKARREGRRDDAVRTAGKLLALQMQRHAEEEEQKRRDEADRPVAPPTAPQEEEIREDQLVYVEELEMTQQERQKSRSSFRRKDQYHLPELDTPLSEMGGPNDPRVMSMEELQQYARQFDTGEDINVYDFSKIDFDSPFFTSLPATDRYNILNAARLRSRLRMGYSKDQLDTMFPDRMAFSKFQIERVRERNDLTQRLMAVGTAEEFLLDTGGRVAGEKGREYVLVKNPGVEGGWALGVIGGHDKEEGQRSKPIDVDEIARQANVSHQPDPSSESSDDEVGLNDQDIVERRKAFYGAQKRKIGAENTNDDDDHDGLFVTDTSVAKPKRRRVGDAEDSEEEAELQRAIAMSLEGRKTADADSTLQGSNGGSDSEDDFYDNLIEQSKAQEFRPFAGIASGGIASVANKRAAQIMPKPASDGSSSDEDDFSFDRVAANFRKQASTQKEVNPTPRASKKPNTAARSSTSSTANRRHTGPLPFEKLDLGASLLGKKKIEEIQEKESGGFEKEEEKKAQNVHLPPWFKGDIEKNVDAQRELEHEDLVRNQRQEQEEGFAFQKLSTLRRKRPEVIDLDAEDTSHSQPILVDPSSEEEVEDDDYSVEGDLQRNNQHSIEAPKFGDIAESVRADPITVDQPAQAPSIPPISKSTGKPASREEVSSRKESGLQPSTNALESDMDPRLAMKRQRPDDMAQNPHNIMVGKDDDQARSSANLASTASNDFDIRLSLKRSRPDTQSAKDDTNVGQNEKPVSANNDGDDLSQSPLPPQLQKATSSDHQETPPRKEQPDDESRSQEAQAPQDDADHSGDEENVSEQSGSPDVYVPDDMDEMLSKSAPEKEDTRPESGSPDVYVPGDLMNGADSAVQQQGKGPQEGHLVSGLANQDAPLEGPYTYDDQEYDGYSDPEDEDLMANLAAEAEEHARFASSLSNKPQSQSLEEYERELKALRSQQKRDRRDADEVTHIMITECQQLLKLFGLPYITAPMEAEAQCAELVRLGLVDGIVTDDSDCFLFGGTRIYKNMFNSAKFVECYLMTDLEREFDLTRPRLIRLAQLLGSDYTEGLPGIGPVTALEILSEFADGLDEFKNWWTSVQMAEPPSAEDLASPFRKKFRRNAARLFLPAAFPDARVDTAYLHPDVDADPQPFAWGVPDLPALRRFLMATIGWSQDRTDEVLLPVIRDMNRRELEGTQANITAFLGAPSSGGNIAIGAGAFAPRVRNSGKSTRMESALGRMAERAKLRRKGHAIGHGDGDPDDQAVAGVTDRTGDVPVASMRSAAADKSKGKKSKRKATIEQIEDAKGEAAQQPDAKKTRAKRTTGRSRKKRVTFQDEDHDDDDDNDDNTH